MNAPPTIAATGAVDLDGITGTSGVNKTWQDLESTAPGDGRTFRAVFGRNDETFRRLDVASRALVLACEAAGIDRVLPRELCADTALVVETSLGCLDADLQFAASLRAEMCDAPIFPYTLPSTCLGEIALRHGLRGISECLCVAPAERGAALAEGARLIANGEAPAVLVATVDVLTRAIDGALPQCTAVAAVLLHPRFGREAVAPWPGTTDAAWDELRRRRAN